MDGFFDWVYKKRISEDYKTLERPELAGFQHSFDSLNEVFHRLIVSYNQAIILPAVAFF